MGRGIRVGWERETVRRGTDPIIRVRPSGVCAYSVLDPIGGKIRIGHSGEVPNYAFIDGQNVKRGFKRLGYNRPNRRRLRVHLRETYEVTRAFYFLGRVPEMVGLSKDFIASKGWTLAEGCTFTDNDVSGATFDRPGLNALLAALAMKPRSFDVLVMMDASRLGR